MGHETDDDATNLVGNLIRAYTTALGLLGAKASKFVKEATFS